MNEANWTFEICYELRRQGIPFELEMVLPVGRVDIAIVEGCFIYGVIEVKKQKQDRQSFQFKRYASMGVPFHHSYPSDDIVKLVLMCKKWHGEAGRKLDDIRECEMVIKRPKRIKPIINPEWDESLIIR